MSYSKSIQNLINAFRKLPTVGQRTAERFVFYLLKSGKKEVGEITLSLKELIDNVRSCEECWDFGEQSPCSICAQKSRDKNTICVIAEPQDIEAIEHTGAYTGTYHVLRGVLEGGEDDLGRLKIKELFERLQNADFDSGQNRASSISHQSEIGTKEIILALNPDLPGETTMLFLEKNLKEKFPALKVSRLARGLPMGSDLQYADEITLGSAIKNRTTK